LKAKKLDRNLRDLFRSKLGKAEITPDPAVYTQLMRKLAVREFLHFNPFRFNVYYLGGIVAAGITAGVLITGNKAGGELSSLQMTEMLAPVSDTSGISLPVVVPPVLKEPVVMEPRETLPADTSSSSAVVISEAVQVNKPAAEKQPGIDRSEINAPLKGKDIVSISPVDDNLKLQGSTLQAEAFLIPSVSTGCAPLKVQFHNSLTGYDSCYWTFGDGGSSTVPDPEWIYDIDGEYKVGLKVFGADGIVSTSSVMISVYPRPVARFEISPEKVVLPDEEVHFLNYSTGAVRYLWDFGDGNSSEHFEPVHLYEKYGNYDVSLKAFSENGCSDSLVVYNAFSGSAYFIEFPNAFIPNPGGPTGGRYSTKSDESGQVFHPSCLGVSEYNLKIFSKLGVLIFESNDVNIGWDGYFKGQLVNPGVYIWKVRGNFRNGEPFTRMGDVTLLKN
jgi:PKD repeat protein